MPVPAPADLPVTCPECGQGVSAEICAYCGANVLAAAPPPVAAAVPRTAPVVPVVRGADAPAPAPRIRSSPGRKGVPRKKASWGGFVAVTVAALAPACALALLVAVLVTEILHSLGDLGLPGLFVHLLKAGAAGFAAGLCVGMAHRVFRRRRRAWVVGWGLTLSALAALAIGYLSTHPLALQGPWEGLGALERLLTS